MRFRQQQLISQILLLKLKKCRNRNHKNHNQNLLNHNHNQNLLNHNHNQNHNNQFHNQISD